MSVLNDKPSIHPSARIGDSAHIYPNVVVEDNCIIGEYVILGHPTHNPSWQDRTLTIPSGSVIRSHTVIYEGCTFKSKLETGHHVVIREGTQAGLNLRAGNFSDIEGDCCIGDYCRFHGYAHIGKGSTIGHFVWLFSLVTLTNDPLPPSHLSKPVVIHDGAVLAVGVTPLPGTVVGKGAFVSAGSQISGCIPDAAVYANGKIVCGIHRLRSLEQGISHPWMNHFKDAYPEESWSRIDTLRNEIILASKQLKI
jgi:acetyltransferase-like isoleucine patch superfamily enzyme